VPDRAMSLQNYRAVSVHCQVPTVGELVSYGFQPRRGWIDVSVVIFHVDASGSV